MSDSAVAGPDVHVREIGMTSALTRQQVMHPIPVEAIVRVLTPKKYVLC